LRQDIDDLQKKEFDLCISDEVVKIKNPGAGVTQATREIKGRMRWGLSGYPLENRLEELVSIFAYLKPGLLTFNDAVHPWKVKEAIEPYFLRRRKIDVLKDLPPKVHEEVWLELSPTQREAYERAEQEGKVQLNERGDSVTVTHVLALITKLKQICNLEPVSQESCESEYLQEHLEEICEQGDKALIFSQYPEKTLRFLEPKLTDFRPLVYHGALSDTQRDRIVDAFQESDENKVLLMSVRAGGLGLWG
jgi:SNF2 family DNA or RNA helicase